MENHTDHIDENEIRAKAHEFWILRGCPKGSPEVDWERAERFLRKEAQQFSAATQPSVEDVVTPRRVARA